MARGKSEVPADKLALYDALVATRPDIERKGVNMPYTSVNGHMYTIMSKAGQLGIRLSPAEREAFIEKYHTELYVNYGTVMKEYVAVPDDLLSRTAELAPYLDLSFRYVSTLKPKSSRKK